MTLGERLNKFISTCYKNQTHFANILQISPSSVSNWVKDTKKPSREYIEKIHELGCSSNWLLYGEGDMYAGNEAGMYLADQHGFQKDKDLQEKTYDMMKELRDKMIEGLISPRVAANSKVGEKPEDYNSNKDDDEEKDNDKDDSKTTEPK